MQTQKSECKSADGHNPPRTESLAIGGGGGAAQLGPHKWVGARDLRHKLDALKAGFIHVATSNGLIQLITSCGCGPVTQSAECLLQRIAGGNKNPWDYRSWSEQHSYHGKWLQYPEIRTSGPVCGLDPA